MVETSESLPGLLVCRSSVEGSKAGSLRLYRVERAPPVETVEQIFLAAVELTRERERWPIVKTTFICLMAHFEGPIVAIVSWTCWVVIRLKL